MVQTTGEKVGKGNRAVELMRTETVVTVSRHRKFGDTRVEKKGSLKQQFWMASRKMKMGDCC